MREVRKRVVANRWLGLWVVCCNCTIAVLLIAVMLMRSIRGPLIAALAVVTLAAIATAIAAWYTKPSAYGLAQRLDHESHLGDRISTAVYFWTVAKPDELLRRQRADALAHLAKVQPRELFPLQAPPKMWRTGALLVALAALCAFHSVYGPAIPRLAEKAARSRTLATLFSPMTRAIEFARAEKKGLADLVAGNDHDRQASETQKPGQLPPTGQPTGSAQATANAAKLDMSQAQQMANAGTPSEGQAPSGAVPNQQAGTPANAQNASATDQQATQSATGQGQQSLGQKALQALENLMSSALSGQQNSGQSPSTASQPPNAGTTSMQAMAGSSQIASVPNQAAQGQTSNSQGSQNQTTPTPGKHTGAGNGTSPWQPRDAIDPQLAGNVAKQHVALQSTGYRGPPGKERSDVAPGTAQIPLQDLSPQRVTTVNGAGQDSVPPRYRQYVQNYFQHSGK
ncbi:MAG TPA: hypothetical protein VJS43_03490 [Candidatus Acidoferrales bacterium]|nr:hypothetical protein [Candidatus Acidoferrales bacterium]